jgi:cytochrome oxidase assembly protein ShyY1
MNGSVIACSLARLAAGSPRRGGPVRSVTVLSFLVKPRWLVLTVLVVVATVAMVLAGFWQLRRLDERRGHNAVIRARTAAPAVAAGDVLRAGQPLGEAGAAVEWQTLTATGTYDAERGVLVRNRSLDGAPGYHVVTPLVLGDGTALLVNRGWIPLSPAAGQSPQAPPPPTGEVTVEGRARATQERGALGPRDPADGVLTEVARVDVARLAQQLPYPVLPAYVELTGQTPDPSSPLPRLIRPPELDEGPHLAYAVQWFIFASLAVIGWVVLVRRQVRSNQRAHQRERVAGGEGGPDGRRRRGEDPAHQPADVGGIEHAP